MLVLDQKLFGLQRDRQSSGPGGGEGILEYVDLIEGTHPAFTAVCRLTYVGFQMWDGSQTDSYMSTEGSHLYLFFL